LNNLKREIKLKFLHEFIYIYIYTCFYVNFCKENLQKYNMKITDKVNEYNEIIDRQSKDLEDVIRDHLTPRDIFKIVSYSFHDP